MKTVFIPPIVDYGFLKQLPQQIADQFHKAGYRVIFCGIQQNFYHKREIKENFIVYSSANYALKEIEEQKIKIDILYNTWAKNYNYIEMLQPKVSIYHSCDSFDEWKTFEPKIMELSDLVFCTSQYIYDMRKKQHDKVFLCRNGCNEDMIDLKEYVIYEQMKFVKRPIFCFCGAIGKWVSTYLMKKIADEFYTIMAGLEFGKSRPKNINYLGEMTHDNLINLYYNCDFGLLPFDTKQEVTLAANPIKMYEYLACGLPVLATSWAETEQTSLKDVIFTAKTKEQYFTHASNMALLSESDRTELKHECFKIAKDNTWEKRFEIIQKELIKYV